MTADGAFNAGFSLVTTVSVLLLVSLGLAVVFGLRRVINLAHGEFIMFGAFATLTATRAGVGLWGAMLVAVAVTAAFGLVVELTLIRHLYERPADTMLATWGLSLILVQLADLVYGSVTEGIPTPTAVANLAHRTPDTRPSKPMSRLEFETTRRTVRDTDNP